MKRNKVLFFIALVFACCGSWNGAIAATPKQVICNKAGTLVVRTAKCKKGETKASLPQIVQQSVSTIPSVAGPQGPTGAKGDTGPAGPQGSAASFSVSGCYYRESTNGPLADAPANTASTRSLSCLNTSTDFLLTSNFVVSPIGSANNKPFVQGKSLTMDATGKYPVGVSYYYLQSTSGGNPYASFVNIICCKK